MDGIVDRFERIYSTEPQRPLVVWPSARTTITASDIWRQHQDYIDRLRRLGLRSGDLLVCAIGNRPEMLSILLACRALDVAVMALDTGATAIEVRSLSQRFGAAAVVTSEDVPSVTGRTSWIAAGLILARGEGDAAAYPGIAMLKVTSGSSGPPRATRTTEAQLIADSTQIAATMSIGPDDTQLAAIPLAHAYGFSVILLPVLLQGTGMILRESFVPPQLVVDARDFGARSMPGVPFMFEHFINHPPAGGWPRGLTRLISAGARLPPRTIGAFHERFGVKVHTFYGTTESGGIAYDDSDDIDDHETVGRQLRGVTVTLQAIDDMPEGCGRVHVRSAAVSDGYVGEASADFVGGGFLTGDYGTLSADGRLTLEGRVSSFINVAGRKVRPEEVEAVLRQMPGIVDVRVVGTVDAQRGQQVVACVETGPGGAAPGLLDVRRFCSTRLAPHKIPRTVVPVDAIPRTVRGKLDRDALERLVRSRLEPPS